MSKFNWWRRYKKKPVLTRKQAFKGKSFLLQQIEHGDLDFSDYRRQALEELDRMEHEKQTIKSKHTGRSDSLQELLDQCERRYRKRYNKLMEDFDREENATIKYLREALVKEFKVDLWDQIISKCDGDMILLYKQYKQAVNK